ncbi:MAG TPA: hypothetical protein VFR47_26680 [Anaerolineales bacterium]|nr:hypothetical protein [Anaerolineales bacterium]
MKKPPMLLRYLLPQPRDILFIGVFFSILFGGPRLFNNDGDLGRHITIGNYILDTGTIPTHDIFSHTMYGERLVPHEWMAQVLFALAHRAMGLSGDVLLAALLGSLTILIVYEELIRRGTLRLVALFLSALVAVVSSIHWLARPHMFTFFFVALWAYGLERFYKNENKRIWFFPLLMLIWVNTHGGFIAGFVILGAYVADWIWEYLQGRGTKNVGRHMGRQLLLVGFLSLAVTFINPSGWHLWGTSVGYVSNDYMTSHTVEYLSPDFHERDVWPFLLMVAIALFGLAQDRKVHVREALLLAGWTVMSLYSVRNLPLFAVVTAPTYATLIQNWVETVLNWLKQAQRIGPRESENTLRGYVWVVVTVLFFGFVLWRGIPLDQKGTGNVFLRDKMPVQAVDWLEQNPQEGKVFNQFVWGGYLLYRMWPDEVVFIDGQTDFYGETLMREYIEVITLTNGWEEILTRHDVSWMLIPRHEMLATHLYTDETWTAIYEDDTAVIFRRK